jgi:hypothetical protein
MRFRIIASRHSAFYAPLLNCICMLRDEGHQVIYTVLQPGQRSYALLRDREVDVMQIRRVLELVASRTGD